MCMRLRDRVQIDVVACSMPRAFRESKAQLRARVISSAQPHPHSNLLIGSSGDDFSGGSCVQVPSTPRTHEHIARSHVHTFTLTTLHVLLSHHLHTLHERFTARTRIRHTTKMHIIFVPFTFVVCTHSANRTGCTRLRGCIPSEQTGTRVVSTTSAEFSRSPFNGVSQGEQQCHHGLVCRWSPSLLTGRRTLTSPHLWRGSLLRKPTQKIWRAGPTSESTAQARTTSREMLFYQVQWTLYMSFACLAPHKRGFSPRQSRWTCTRDLKVWSDPVSFGRASEIVWDVKVRTEAGQEVVYKASYVGNHYAGDGVTGVQRTATGSRASSVVRADVRCAILSRTLKA